jgi:hypothetical protein
LLVLRWGSGNEEGAELRGVGASCVPARAFERPRGPIDGQEWINNPLEKVAGKTAQVGNAVVNRRKGITLGHNASSLRTW